MGKSLSSRRGRATIVSGGKLSSARNLRYILVPILICLASLSVHFSRQIDTSTKPTTTSNNDVLSDAPNNVLQSLDSDATVEKDESKSSSAVSSQFVLNQQYLKHLQSLEQFPKQLHVLFPHKDYYKQHPELNFVKNGILRFIKLNPQWNVTVYDDTDMDNIITMAANDGIISQEEMIELVGNTDTQQPPAHPVERADLARMLIIWYYGGLYVDADSLTNARDFNKVFHPTIKMCLPIYLNINFAQSIVCSSPKNQLYMDMIKGMSLHRMKSNHGKPIERKGGWASTNSLFSMGPPMYNNMVFQRVFNKKISGHGDIPGIQEAMGVLKKEASDLIATGQYINQCKSFLSEDYEGCKGWNRDELYTQYNMGSWSSAVKKRWNTG